ncbi:MAG: DUF262 domain-containing HNH endonuclease family protein [Polaromonas sp.]|uniref:DUF262 domain-containing protein n=1 Tax=Polaromonas sp. TaxID=1869339 RepID=UPI00248702B5|nr:DUF262 domain-containing HNH endonuclease family protein [Polaromonas sp.]MDI1238654.1 DUF262 domain-containing HNH endonuclease family protein [Polaromonas sp.]
MDSDRTSVHQLFKPERQYCVPFYQRAYVWSKQDQWSRLWLDIQQKAEARLADLPPTPHFMGAIVLEPQERKKILGVEKVHIIDGQQRITTLQFALAALTIVLRNTDCVELLPAVETCLQNSDLRNMRDKSVEPFKVWPTFYDRGAYERAIVSTSFDDLRRDFPEHFTQQATLKKVGINHPPALAAIWYFAEQMTAWMKTIDSPPNEASEALVSAVLDDLVIIAITLDAKDDAQVIFETLNGHGVELTATDLIRNYVFLNAEAEGSDAAALYTELWSRYESRGWKSNERRGRLNRPRTEWFVQTVLQAELRDEVDQGRIYAEYQRYVKATGISAEGQLHLLDEYADSYEALLDGNPKAPIGHFGKRFAQWDASTTYVLALAIARSGGSEAEQNEMFNTLGSYLIRRAICKLTNKNYNKVFLQVLRNLKGSPLTSSSLSEALKAFSGDAGRWPRDDEFLRHFVGSPMYGGHLDTAKMRSVLVELENALRTERSEEPITPSLDSLDIDHMLPQSWTEHWPLGDGSVASAQEVVDVNSGFISTDARTAKQAAIAKREQLIPTFGNLTLLHYGTNRAAKNYSFEVKKDLFLSHTNLHLNRSLLSASVWGEDEITQRGNSLWVAALRIWPGPVVS